MRAFVVGAGVAMWLVATAAPAPAMRLGASVAAGGAQQSTGSGLALRATVGQGAVGGSLGTSFDLCSGFWCVSGASVVGVPGGPGPGSTSDVPRQLEFGPAFPNPARGAVQFDVGLPADAVVAFSVHDLAGRRVSHDVSQRMRAGRHRLRWSADPGRTGVYFVRIAVNGVSRAHHRVVLVR